MAKKLYAIVPEAWGAVEDLFREIFSMIDDSNVRAGAAIKGSKLAAGTVTATELGTGAVTNVKLGADAVTTDKIADGAVATADLANLAVTTAKLAAGAVTANELGAAAVTTAKLASEAVDAAALAKALIQSMMQGRRSFVETAQTTQNENAGTPVALTTADSISFTPSVGGVNYEITAIYEADYANNQLSAAQAHIQLDGTDIGHVDFPVPSAVDTFARTLGTVVSTNNLTAAAHTVQAMYHVGVSGSTGTWRNRGMLLVVRRVI